MLKLTSKLFTVCAALLLSASVFAAPPAQLWQVKKELIQYHNDGRYAKELAQVIVKARDYLEKRIQENKQLHHPKKLAIVLDIDETALSNYDSMVRLDFGGSIDELYKEMLKGTDTAIRPTLELYNFALKHHVKVFFVTGRKEFSRQATKENLLKAGFKNWAGLVLKPNDYNEKSAIPFKAAAREVIEKMGYDIVMTIGDQYSDINGGHADKGFKLPNPYYYIA